MIKREEQSIGGQMVKLMIEKYEYSLYVQKMGESEKEPLPFEEWQNNKNKACYK